MSDNENKAAVGRGIEMVNEAVRFRQEHPDDAAGIQRNIEAIVARHLNHMGDGYTNTSPRTGLWTEAGFPDRQFTIDEQIAEGDAVWTRYTVRGTHLGEWEGHAPTGKEFSVTGVLIQRLEDGKIADDFDFYDQAGLVAQLGVTVES